MNTYKTNEVAKIIGIHVNTVRLYEECMLIPQPERLNNGYRVFTDLHIEQFRLARAALQVAVLQNGLRKQAINIIKISAKGDYDEAARQTHKYMEKIEQEIHNAEEAIKIAEHMLSSSTYAQHRESYTRKETAALLQVTADTLRNWELNGLITIKRKENRYLTYSYDDIQRLKIIRSLRCANYSLSSILRMFNELSRNPGTDIREIINTPKQNDDVITCCDKLLTSLSEAKTNALYVLSQIEKLKQLQKQKPTL